MKAHVTDADTDTAVAMIQAKPKGVSNRPELIEDEQTRISRHEAEIEQQKVLVAQQGVRDIVFKATLRAGEHFSAGGNYDLQACYIAYRPGTGAFLVYTSPPSDVGTSAVSLFKYLRPFNGTDLRHLNPAEVQEAFAGGRRPRSARPDPENQTEALVEWASKHLKVPYVSLQDRPDVEIPQWSLDADRKFSREGLRTAREERETRVERGDAETVDISVPELNGTGSNGNGAHVAVVTAAVPSDQPKIALPAL